MTELTKEQQVRALREARFKRRHPDKAVRREAIEKGHVKTEIELLRDEVKRLKRELAKANRHG